ncbi:MAG: hypothetical protein JSR58_00320 [Verrucomicrobia bacterium]|nr:hypothetical protein [Verrucomicrobiota bacterium]
MTTLETELEKCTQILQNLDLSSFLLEEALKAFEHLIDSLERHGKEPHIIEKMALIGKRMTLLGERFVSASGMQEEELLALFDNPKPFPKEKWDLAHETEQHLLRVVKNIAIHIGETPSTPHHEGKKHLHQPPRSKWMKS